MTEREAPKNVPRILLLQARQPGDSILKHEYECFVARTRYPTDAFTTVNLAEERVDRRLLADVDLVTVGGAGEFSIVEGGFRWYDELLDLMGLIVEREIPMFASCFGFHALVQCFGGRLETDPESAEIGTHEIRVTEEGSGDEFFGHLPERFNAQLGHKDSVVELPDGLVRLAHSERCRVQAVRVPKKPVVATQFHPELTAKDNIERYVRYIQNYKKFEETHEDALARAEDIHAPSPEANELLGRFVERLFHG